MDKVQEVCILALSFHDDGWTNTKILISGADLGGRLEASHPPLE